MSRKRIIVPAVCAVLSALSLSAVMLGKDIIIINFRLHAWQAARNACMVALAASAVWVFAAAVTGRRCERPLPELPDPKEKKALTEEIRNALYAELKGFGEGKWSRIGEIKGMLAQLDSMDEYQEKLGPLLEQTDYLKQKPAEIVQRVEDCMYVNIKKLLNYMRVLQTKDPSTMSGKARECMEKNADLLKKTDDFVVAVVGYINGDMAPGEESRTKEYVDNYMFLVLDAIELPETYLK